MSKFRLIVILAAVTFNAPAQDRAGNTDLVVYNCVKDGASHYTARPLDGAECHAIRPDQPAASSNDISMQGVLAIAKQTGACGILQSMSAFQASTKLDGGDAFIVRFWSTEAARLGKSPEQYVKDCQSSIDAYDKLWQLSGELEK